MSNVQGGSQQIDIFDELSMDSDSLFVFSLIQKRRGRDHAISVADISESTGIPPRVVRDIVKHLIECHAIRIGSALSAPSGYYMIETMEEAEQNEQTLRRLGISILTRAAVLKKLTVAEYIREIQGELGL